jgi:hypothetical protein
MWDDALNLREFKIQLRWAGFTEEEIEQILRKEIGNERQFLPEPCDRDSNS